MRDSGGIIRHSGLWNKYCMTALREMLSHFPCVTRLNWIFCSFFISSPVLANNVTEAFERQRRYEPHGPLVSEALTRQKSPKKNRKVKVNWQFGVDFAGELRVLHWLAGPLGGSARCRRSEEGQPCAGWNASYGGQRQHVCSPRYSSHCPTLGEESFTFFCYCCESHCLAKTNELKTLPFKGEYTSLFSLRYMFEGGTNFGYWNGKVSDLFTYLKCMYTLSRDASGAAWN